MNPFFAAFLVGGVLCALAQVFMDVTKVHPAHVMVLFVILGALASGLGFYEPLVLFGGAGATVPLTGFGHVMVQGTLDAVTAQGLPGVLSGGLAAASGGIGSAIIFGYIVALMFNPRG
jgi:stage V sporulation protein AE